MSLGELLLYCGFKQMGRYLRVAGGVKNGRWGNVLVVFNIAKEFKLKLEKASVD